jgi:hypothetical protein
MTERLLQYIWQFQYFNKSELTTTAGEQLVIIHPGLWNTHQGPDFREGRVKVGEHIWAGNIELHILASDWNKHLHSSDVNYHNVILHVVWKHDVLLDELNIPTVVLEDRVPKVLLQQYFLWMESDRFIPCEATISSVDTLVWTSWKERLLFERMERKSTQLITMLDSKKYHWEDALWWMLARNFGLHVNADAFGEMALSLPFQVIGRHRTQIHQLEALLLGQCKLLNACKEDGYVVMLKKEYAFLKKKYKLEQIEQPVHFLRMRPACFPSIRLAQLAMVLKNCDSLFATVINSSHVKEVRKMLDVTANDYWHYHFVPGEESPYSPKRLGLSMINNILVNTIVVMLFSYGRYHREPSFENKAMKWISDISSEQNNIISKFKKLGVKVKNAADSQSLIELKAQYCDSRRCLDCAIANSMLKNNGVTG